mmetsp:Transcript_17600/g.22840  ORF Transcript_17600/g.22840 Transcript_17600/m.22840 type:complete len:104 (+) Transcript_17600:1159-1470(+)
MIAKYLINEFFCRYGCPRVLLSDRGAIFLSKIMRAVYEIFLIEKRSTTPYNPKCNGLCERLNKTLIEIISKYVNSGQTDWDDFLPYALMSYRAHKHKTTKLSP